MDALFLPLVAAVLNNEMAMSINSVSILRLWELSRHIYFLGFIPKSDYNSRLNLHIYAKAYMVLAIVCVYT